jgi:uncharacterized protein involved in exopolysaccharide biosynthesis
MSGQISRAAAPEPGHAGTFAARSSSHTGTLAHFTRRWWVVALAIVISSALAVVYLAQATPRYRATAVLASGYGATATGVIPPDEFLDAQKQIILSDPVLTAAATTAPAIPSVRDALRVQTSTGDGSITISVDAADPQQAARATNAIAETYLQERASAQARAGKSLSALTATRDQRAARRDAAEKALSDFRAASATVGGDSSKAAAPRLEQVNQTLAAARAEVDSAQDAIDGARSIASDPAKSASTIEAARAAGIFAGLDAQQLELAEQLRAAEVRLEQQRQTLLPRHPVLIATQREIEQLKLKRDALDQQYLQAYQAHLEKQQLAAEKRLQEVQDLVSAQQKLVAEYSTHAQRREALETQLQQADAALADADAKLRDALLNADTAGPEVKLVQPARAPSQPIYPNRLLMLLMAPGVGALAGVLIVILESTLR